MTGRCKLTRCWCEELYYCESDQSYICLAGEVIGHLGNCLFLQFYGNCGLISAAGRASSRQYTDGCGTTPRWIAVLVQALEPSWVLQIIQDLTELTDTCHQYFNLFVRLWCVYKIKWCVLQDQGCVYKISEVLTRSLMWQHQLSHCLLPLAFSASDKLTSRKTWNLH